MNAQLVNLMGAAAIAVSDQIYAATAMATGQSPSFAAALVIIDRYPRVTVDVLGQYLSLSQSGAARLVERLVGQDLVTRQRGEDKRFVYLQLTAAGQVRVQAIQQAREEAVGQLLTPLTTAEQIQLLSLLTKLANHSPLDDIAEEHLCRFCNIHLCPLPACQERVEQWQAAPTG
ncbi:MAG: winged helix DNA-binding protein [Leptolyngbya sp. SIOISBB]|nr:winged helix DNA-binding protein [Leptolyngbya sp. SIOISBB]